MPGIITSISTRSISGSLRSVSSPASPFSAYTTSMPCCSSALVRANTLRTSSSTIRIRLPVNSSSPSRDLVRRPAPASASGSTSVRCRNSDTASSAWSSEPGRTRVSASAYGWQALLLARRQRRLGRGHDRGTSQRLARPEPLQHVEAAAAADAEVDHHAVVAGPVERRRRRRRRSRRRPRRGASSGDSRSATATASPSACSVTTSSRRWPVLRNASSCSSTSSSFGAGDRLLDHVERAREPALVGVLGGLGGVGDDGRDRPGLRVPLEARAGATRRRG